MLTPRYISRTLAAGAIARIDAYGQHILIVTISASTVALGLDDDPPQQLVAGQHIDVGDRKYRQIILQETGGIGCTVVMLVSTVYVDLQYTGGVLGGMAASLIAIDADLELLKPPSVGTIIPLGAVAQTGIGSTQLVTAAGVNRKCLVQADQDNTGSVYLAYTNAVTAALSFCRLLPGESWMDEWAGNIWACSTNGTEQVRGYVAATV